jgi:MoaA/NifB/PqqE/SkfB family radical SAM enzyme
LSVQPSTSQELRQLPLAILYITDRCNSRCVTCDYWRHGRETMTLERVEKLLPSLKRLGTEMVLLSGGEPLMNPQWHPIAQMLRSRGMKLWLLTSGLSLAKHARRAAASFDHITVSLDGADPDTYQKIRGLDAFELVCEGVRAVADCGLRAGIRVTLQHSNFQQLPRFVDLAAALGAREVSFLAVDVANPHAFGRSDAITPDLALQTDELDLFEALITALERARPEDFASGFIAESPQKLRRILQYFAAIRGQAHFPRVRCNAPEFSAVIGASGRVQPCFFIPGPVDAGASAGGGGDAAPDEFADLLNRRSMTELRAAIRRGERRECATCVCSMLRDPPTLQSLLA